ncbi:carbohydrate ABC transporter permease [Bacillus thuringiensis]|uniref:ABC transporter permease n=1 Tax=Bacillus thuringiensis serovar mexicanensis TaxID=180868 RepID=A0A242WFA6_BACTU|nr:MULTISPECIES: carbohydrate ABC transporter permease [Bacillus cereus group]KAB5639543.1 carbohydrate ABC transporter permease [Bacillus thuringiensis]MEB9670103.1 carbohydrate ABC transporter permease [Bacillus anthracis]OTW55674.1 ABC transporter permease [Bacillus thuringiensis serovar mexicanensis]OTX05525.1 ABC transporter permease [Bacillus thuringiensis serovar monterrey]HDR5270949.1 carbohydrate ABC transporter permease [Bacillus thuringiensis]
MQQKKWSRVIMYIVLIGYGLVTLYPFLWAVLAAFKPYKEIVSGGLSLLPQEPTLDNFKYIFTRDPLFTKWIINSFIIAILGTIVNVILNTMSGYALARLRFPGRNYVFLLILTVMMVPGQILLIPNYLIMRSLGFLDTYAALILPGAINFAYIFMMRQFFVNFPKEIEEAAQVEGLSRFKTFWKIVFPMARASVATQAVFVFLAFWNEFLKPLLFITSPEKYTLTLGLQSFQSQNATQWNYIMAASVISIIPIIIIYIVLNRYFMQGFRIGGDK